MNIFEHYSLEHLNTFGFKVSARYFVEVTTLEELTEALAFARSHDLTCIPVGGGSNLVLRGDIQGLVIAVNICERQVLSRANGAVSIKAGAGENWDDLVRWTLAQGAYGLENLSLIPGNVGAAPIQNIGAYGVELKDCFESLEAVEISSGKVRRFSLKECQFGYRDSAFKQALKDQYIITSVILKLSDALQPTLEYGQLREMLQNRCGSARPTGLDISQVVSEIRRQKLPDPEKLGNAGSFFKNPVINSSAVDRLREQYPDLVAFPFGQQWKLAAGWMIDKAGFRGCRKGQVGAYQNQALVLVNYGGATPGDLLALVSEIQTKVRAMFGVDLEMEPRVYG